MPKRLTVADHLSAEQLEAHYKSCKNPVEKIHWQIIWLLAQGHSIQTVSGIVGFRIEWVRKLVSRYNNYGPAGLEDRRAGNKGRPRLVDNEVLADLHQLLAKSGEHKDQKWTGPRVARWLSDRLGRTVHPQRGWEVLRRYRSNTTQQTA